MSGHFELQKEDVLCSISQKLDHEKQRLPHLPRDLRLYNVTLVHSGSCCQRHMEEVPDLIYIYEKQILAPKGITSSLGASNSASPKGRQRFTTKSVFLMV